MSATKRILIVDDDATIRELVELALTDEGYETLPACHGAEALTLLNKRPVDLILLDIRMPVMDGWAFARAYSALPGPHAPIIVLSASRTASEAAADIAVAEFLSKPFEIGPLLAAVARTLDGREPKSATPS